MKTTAVGSFVLVLGFGLSGNVHAEPNKPRPNLIVSYGARGVEQVSYRGKVIEDLNRWPADAFHIWHMKCFDSLGKTVVSGQYGWGENSKSHVWDAASKTWTYTFDWGTISSTFVQHGDTLDIHVNTVNYKNSGIVFDGATVYPLTLHLPQVSLGAPGLASRVVDGLEEPGLTLATWDHHVAGAITPHADVPVWSGFEGSKDGSVAAVLSGTRPDSMVSSTAPREGLRLRPGQTLAMDLSIRFGSDSASATMTEDALKNFARRWPATLNWKDRRIISTVYLASSAEGDKTQRAGFPNNPRRYFNEKNLNLRDPASLESFQKEVLGAAQTIVQNLRSLHAQGVITWDIEGQEYPQDTSYLCSPDLIAQLAPEMESVVSDRGSRYAGLKLDDAYFKIIRDAGFRVGVCVRPQHLAVRPDGRAQQIPLSDADAVSELKRKIRYAHDRWGATLFYLDSTVRGDGSTLPAEALESAAASVPDSLIIPEESTVRAYRATAPLMSFLFHGDLGTNSQIRALYPHAFTANLINDVDSFKLVTSRKDLISSVRHGDILMVRADRWQANNPIVAEFVWEAADHH